MEYWNHEHKASQTFYHFPGLRTTMTPRAFQLRDLQRTAIARILSPPKEPEPGWKLLILDSSSAEVVTPLLSPADLRRHGVTLQLNIEAQRGELPDVPVVYIISPTAENLARVLRDLDGHKGLRRGSSRLYTTASLAFTAPLPRPLLRDLAAQLRIPARVSALYDLYTDYVALEEDLFSAGIRNSYVELHSHDETRQLRAVDAAVSALFCVLVGLRVVPIIRAQRGGASEAIARALDARLRDNLELFQRPAPGTRLSSFRRPLLLLLDRDLDLAPVLHHTWMYQALMHDCLRMRANALTLSVTDAASGAREQKKYVLDKRTDSFWVANAHQPFPAVAEAIESAVSKYKAEVHAINEQTSGDAATGDVNAQGNTKNATSHLASAISSLPELSRRKVAIDVHTNISTALVGHINERKLDAFFGLESAMLAQTSDRGKPTRANALAHQEQMAVLLREGAGTPADRARAAYLFYDLFGGALDRQDLVLLRELVGECGADSSALRHIRDVRGFSHENVREKADMDESSRARLRGIFSNAMNRGYRGIASFAKSAQTLIGEERFSFESTRTLKMFMSERGRGQGAEDVLEGFLYLDPKIEGSEWVNSVVQGGSDEDAVDRAARRKMRHMVFSDAILFVSGGGNYVEFAKCREVVKEIGDDSNVLYGCSELVNAESFLNQIAIVAKDYGNH